MHRVSIQELIDYAKCPVYYFFKYKSPEYKTEAISLIEKYDDDIHKVIYYAFSRASEGDSIDIKDVKSSWGRAWIKDKRKVSIMFNESLSRKDTYNELRKRGIHSLLQFQKVFSLEPGFPIAINKPYEIQVSKNLTVTGNFELIRENTFKQIEVMTFKTDEHSNVKVVKDNDLKLMASSIAAEEYLGSKDIHHVMYQVDKYNFTRHTEDTINKDLFIFSVNNIFKAMYNKLYYMAPSNDCYFCPYKDICNNRSKVAQILDKEGLRC